MKPDDLPVEALKAGIAAWNDNQDGSYTAAIRMVIVDAIKAWPDVEMLYGSEDEKLYSVILPVPEEKVMAKDWTEQKAVELLENEVKRLRIENIQMQAALGYGITVDDERHIIPTNPSKCGTCDAKSVEIKMLRSHNLELKYDNEQKYAEIERLRGSILEAIEQARLPHYGYKHLQLGNYYDAISILEKALEGK